MHNWPKYAGAALVVVLLGYVFFRPESYRNIDRFNGRCQSIVMDARSGPGLVGVEDIVIDHERGFAYLSATDRRDKTRGRGAIYRIPLHFGTAPLPLTDITLGEPVDFHPHGIDLLIDDDGERRLFVVSHDKGRRANEGARVLIYKLGETGYLELEESVVDADLLYHPNDVAAVGPRSFFATQDFSAPSSSKQERIDIKRRRKTGHLVYAHKGEMTIADVGGFAMANGVAYDAASDTLYVSETLTKELHAYRVTETGGLIPLDRTKISAFPDNFAFSEHGDLYIAGNLHNKSFAEHMQDGSNPSPSGVVRFQRPSNGNALASDHEDIMITSGLPAFDAEEGLSGISVAAAHGDVLLLGSVYEPRIWRCEMDGR